MQMKISSIRAGEQQIFLTCYTVSNIMILYGDNSGDQSAASFQEYFDLYFDVNFENKERYSPISCLFRH